MQRLSSGPSIRPKQGSALLTLRQVECLLWAEAGKSARDTGAILGISPRTVEKHLELAYEALDVRTRIQAVVKARQLGFLD